MELPDSLAAAMRTLTGALDLLDAAAVRRIEADAARADLETELAVMADDRARLARELDGSLDQAETLAAANAEVSRRLDQMSLTLQGMLDEPRPADAAPDGRS